MEHHQIGKVFIVRMLAILLPFAWNIVRANRKKSIAILLLSLYLMRDLIIKHLPRKWKMKLLPYSTAFSNFKTHLTSLGQSIRDVEVIHKTRKPKRIFYRFVIMFMFYTYFKKTGKLIYARLAKMFGSKYSTSCITKVVAIIDGEQITMIFNTSPFNVLFDNMMGLTEMLPKNIYTSVTLGDHDVKDKLFKYIDNSKKFANTFDNILTFEKIKYHPTDILTIESFNTEYCTDIKTEFPIGNILAKHISDIIN